MMKVLYLLNFAGKAGTERYVETLVKYLNGEKIQAYFAYNEGGLLVERLEAMGVPVRQLTMRRRFDLKAARALGISQTQMMRKIRKYGLSHAEEK